MHLELPDGEWFGQGYSKADFVYVWMDETRNADEMPAPQRLADRCW
jgi:hypothetical protein